jgi:hypothetical protein
VRREEANRESGGATMRIENRVRRDDADREPGAARRLESRTESGRAVRTASPVRRCERRTECGAKRRTASPVARRREPRAQSSVTRRAARPVRYDEANREHSTAGRGEPRAQCGATTANPVRHRRLEPRTAQLLEPNPARPLEPNPARPLEPSPAQPPEPSPPPTPGAPLTAILSARGDGDGVRRFAVDNWAGCGQVRRGSRVDGPALGEWLWHPLLHLRRGLLGFEVREDSVEPGGEPPVAVAQ